jgi:hypothetical protein
MYDNYSCFIHSVITRFEMRKPKPESTRIDCPNIHTALFSPFYCNKSPPLNLPWDPDHATIKIVAVAARILRAVGLAVVVKASPRRPHRGANPLLPEELERFKLNN